MSQHPGYHFLGVKAIEEEMANGRMRIIREPLVCEFTHGGLTEWQKDLARKTFSFRGVPFGEDGVTPTDPVQARVSLYDTDADPRLRDDPKLKADVEKNLLAWARPDDHILVSKPELAEPWKGYKTTHHLQIAKIAKSVNALPEAIEYERLHENRVGVISQMEEMLAPEPEEELVQA